MNKGQREAFWNNSAVLCLCWASVADSSSEWMFLRFCPQCFFFFSSTFTVLNRLYCISSNHLQSFTALTAERPRALRHWSVVGSFKCAAVALEITAESRAAIKRTILFRQRATEDLRPCGWSRSNAGSRVTATIDRRNCFLN